MFVFAFRKIRAAAGVLFAIGALVLFAAGAFAAGSTGTTAGDAQTLRVVQFCDPQYGMRKLPAEVARFEQAVRQCNALAPDLVLIAGDLVNNAADKKQVAAFLETVKKIKAPVVLTAGNHDLPDPVTDAGLARYRRYFGDDFVSREVKGRLFVSFNAQLFRRPSSAKHPQEQAEQERHLRKLRETLAGAKSRALPVVVMGHVPPFVSSVDEKDTMFALPKRWRTELLKLFKDAGVFIWCSGHTHRTHRNDLDGIALLNGETTSWNFDKHPYGFRLITIQPDNSFSWEFVPVKGQNLDETNAPSVLPPATLDDFRHGLFAHYMFFGDSFRWKHTAGSTPYADGSPVKSLDELANAFDVEDIAALADAARAQYVVFTVFHANMNLLYPSKVMGAVLPAHTAKRDVITALYHALRHYGIRLVLYFHPTDAHDLSPDDYAKLTGHPFGKGDPKNRRTLPNAGRLAGDAAQWNNFINDLMAEVVERYGDKIAGFFIDGGLPSYLDAPRLRQTVKSRNPALWLVQNAGNRRDFADGANNEDPFRPPYPATAWMRSAVITDDWSATANGLGKMNFNPELAYRYLVLQTGVKNRHGGGAVWSFGPYAAGRWEPGVRPFCEQLGRYVRRHETTIFGTEPSSSWPVRERQPLLGTKTVALTSKDGKRTYLHIFAPPPPNRPLVLPAPADGRKFTTAKLAPARIGKTGDTTAAGNAKTAAGKPAGSTVFTLKQTAAGGLEITPPAKFRWDDLDTVLVLE